WGVGSGGTDAHVRDDGRHCRCSARGAQHGSGAVGERLKGPLAGAFMMRAYDSCRRVLRTWRGHASHACTLLLQIIVRTAFPAHDVGRPTEVREWNILAGRLASRRQRARALPLGWHPIVRRRCALWTANYGHPRNCRRGDPAQHATTDTAAPSGSDYSAEAMQIRGKNHGHLPHLLTVHLFNGNGPRTI